MEIYSVVLALASLALVSGQAAQEEAQSGQKGEENHHWTYEDQQSWELEYPLCLGKNLRQSPIDVVLDDVKFDPSYSLEFIDYDQELQLNFKNTHHSVSVSPGPSDSPPTVKLHWLPGENEFELQEVHFHWGDGVSKGSEHMINHERAAAEMHMVHYKKGVNASDIGDVENSVVVVGVFIESDHYVHNKLESLVKEVAQVNGTDEKCSSDSPNNLLNLLPDYHHSFYTYNGSLTTPPCYEVVTWILLSSPVYMSNDKLVRMSNLKAAVDGSTYSIGPNHRDIQPLLDRPVYASFNVSESVSPKLKKDATHHDVFPGLHEFWRRLAPLRRLQLNLPLGPPVLPPRRKPRSRPPTPPERPRSRRRRSNWGWPLMPMGKK